jgi:hypothetical protein
VWAGRDLWVLGCENFVVKNFFWAGFVRREFAICNKFLGPAVTG